MITAGEVLKQKRESLGKDLKTVSADTKIQKRFLEYIENDQYDKFDSDVFASGFIKIYSRYLGLDVDKMLAVYRRSNLKEKAAEDKKQRKSIKPKKDFKLNITPQIIAMIASTIFLLSIVGYIGFQIYKFQTPPQLSILQPQEEEIFDTEKLLVKGSTENNTTVTINGEQVKTDTLGYFEKEITLNEGINTINITARKNSNTQLETSKNIKVIYRTQREENPIPTPKVYTVKVKILQSSSWIKLDIDGENKISQILEPNTQQEFAVERELTLVTGKIQSTQLLINDEIVEIYSQQNTGVGQITCQVTQDGYKCE